MKATPLNSFFGKTMLYSLCSVILSTVDMSAQNFSRSENRQLNRINDIGSVGVSLFAERIKGQIKSVTVVYESERKLKLSVAFTEFDLHNYTLVAELKNVQKLRQSQFKQVKKNLKGVQSPLELEFNLDKKTLKDTELTSKFLEIRIGSRSLKPVFLYKLNKEWKTGASYENFDIPSNLEPVNKAANLEKSPQKIMVSEYTSNFTCSSAKTELIHLKQSYLLGENRGVFLDGTWINNKKNARSASKIKISNNGKNIQVFGAYNTKDYEKGIRPLTAETNSINEYWAVFNSRIAKSTFMLAVNGNDMEVRLERDYKSANRPTKNYVEKFTRLNLHINNIA